MLAVGLLEFADFGVKNGNNVVILACFVDVSDNNSLAYEAVAAKKLLKLTIDTGIDKRTIVSGIAEYYTPEQLVGRQVLVLANLAPREIKGIESRGMILMAEDALGRLVLVQPEDKTMSGAMIG